MENYSTQLTLLAVNPRLLWNLNVTGIKGLGSLAVSVHVLEGGSVSLTHTHILPHTHTHNVRPEWATCSIEEPEVAGPASADLEPRMYGEHGILMNPGTDLLEHTPIYILNIDGYRKYLSSLQVVVVLDCLQVILLSRSFTESSRLVWECV